MLLSLFQQSSALLRLAQCVKTVGNTRRLSCYYTWTLCKRDQTSRSNANDMDDLSLQVSDGVMATSDPGETLTKFIRRIEARVFAEMQSAPPQEMHDNYGLPADGRPDL